MRRNIIFLSSSILLLFIALTGCTKEGNRSESSTDKNAWYVIPAEKAKTVALQFLQSNLPETRSISSMEIETQAVWRTLTFDNSTDTRSQSSQEQEVPVYIFSLTENNGDNGGYIITVGDKRIPNCVIAFSIEDEWDLSGIPEFETFFWSNVDNYILSSVDPGIDMCDTYELYVIRENDKFVSDYLLKWGQTPSPYNDSLPSCTSTTNVPAGCVAVAMGQIMAYHGKPSSGSYAHPRYGRTVNAQYDWFKIREELSAEYLTTVGGRSGVANLLAEAGYKVYMDYQCNGSGASPSFVPSAFQQMGYNCSSLTTFNLNYIQNDINNNRPVYIRGSNDYGGHAWIIEGYRKLDYDLYIGRDCPPGGGESIPPTFVETFLNEYYLYFNLGWNGYSNGFYHSQIFSSWPWPTNAPQIIYNITPKS